MRVLLFERERDRALGCSVVLCASQSPGAVTLTAVYDDFSIVYIDYDGCWGRYISKNILVNEIF